jgi:uncharacterized membrane protein
MVRILRHLFMPYWLVKRHFPRHVLAGIERAIGESEAAHMGEIRFAVEAALDFWPLMRGQKASERALEVFSRLRVWDTEHNSGVLIYLLLADRDVEIVADRGIHAKVGDAQWQRICGMMEEAFRQGRFEQGVLAGIKEISALLLQHFPAAAVNPDELPDKPVVL